MNIAIITAGGRGERMGNHIPKQFVEVNGKPIILYTLEVFETHSQIDAIIIVCIKEWIEKMRQLVKHYYINKVVSIVVGGPEGQQSIYNGLCEAERLYPVDSIVLIHDSVRPMVDQKLISQNIADVERYGNSITVVPSVETFIIEEKETKKMIMREDVHVVRAPQCFHLKDILSLHRQAITDGRSLYRDCCSMLCDYNLPFHETIGPSTNIKITFPSDILMFRSLILLKETQQMLGM